MDRQIRDLERQAQTGDLASEVQLLRQRLRGGELTDERVDLAAYLGHAASRELLGADAAEVPAGYVDWLQALRQRGPEVTMRASIAAARRVAPVFASLLRPSDPDHPWPVIDAAEQSLTCPCVPHVQAVLEAAAVCTAARNGPNAVRLERWPEAAVAACISLADLFGQPSMIWHVMHHARLAAFALVEGATEEAEDNDTLHNTAGAIVKDTIRAELVPWTLGTADPVRERVEARV